MDDAAHFESGVDLVRAAWIDREAYHARRKSHLAMPWRFCASKLAPVIATVVAAVDANRRESGIKDLRILWMHRERPHDRAALRKAEAIPALAAVRRAIGPILRSHIDDIRVSRVHQ